MPRAIDRALQRQRTWPATLGALLMAALLAAGPARGAGAGLSGRLWHDYYPLDRRDGTQIASPVGQPPAQVTAKLPAWPWPDGSQYVVAAATSGHTSVSSHVTRGGAVVDRVRFEGYLRAVKPSPASKQVILATWGQDSASDAAYVFYDLAKHKVIDSLRGGDAAVHWLPDGRYLRIAASGAITTAQPGAAPQPAGTVAIPAGRRIRGLWLNRQGTQMAMQFIVPGRGGQIDESDLWVAGTDGSRLARLTATRITSYGKWSPDGRHVAFDTDTGLTCGGGHCVGRCSLWYAPATAREVKALEGSSDAQHFKVKNSRGEERQLGCELLAWTD